ncbi:unnamed protein product [Leptosia nina]|uniref:Uncharacterized protein n=1 Tax=Leptosia nina TaxID=320188 RepID=A0AAV1JZI1_9NEOP
MRVRRRRADSPLQFTPKPICLNCTSDVHPNYQAIHTTTAAIFLPRALCRPPCPHDNIPPRMRELRAHIYSNAHRANISQSVYAAWSGCIV